MNPIKHALTASLAIFLLLMIPYCIVLVFCVLTNLPLPYADTFGFGHGGSIAMIATTIATYTGITISNNKIDKEIAERNNP